MCLTGNFALSLIADDAVLAAVASQPSLPFNDQNALHMSSDEIASARASIDQKGSVLALRFEGDPLCRAQNLRLSIKPLTTTPSASS